jgi:type II secretory ATPase GspE/PulE/Tfp pilus assembly ATPase PilB-like protein
MVGEVRDTETAEMAVHAALTGHVVLSTLHTNNAAGCLPRLLDMKVEPFLIASTVNAVIGQRLVRRLCPECREAYEVSKEQIAELIKQFDLDMDFLNVKPPKEVVKEVAQSVPDLSEKTIPAPKGIASHESILDRIAKDPSILNRSLNEAEQLEAHGIREQIFVHSEAEKKKAPTGELSLTLYKSTGCKKCNNTGYVGRVGIYEVLEMSDNIGEMIVGHSSTEEIEKAAIENGMITMAQDGFIKSLMGITTVEEVLRVTRE